MQNASIQFNEYMADGGTLYSKAKITLTDGTELNLNKSDFDINGGFVVSNATSSKSSFDIGMTVIGQLTLKVLNFEGKYNEYDFLGATISDVFVYAELPDVTIESIPKGTYKVEKQTFSGSHITLVAYDKMAEFVSKYTGSLKGTAQELINAMATKHSAVLNTQRFNNSDFEITIPQDDKDYSDRDILQYICEITGNYARFDEEGYLVIGWYDKDLLNQDIIQAGKLGKMAEYGIEAGNFANMSDNDTIIEAGSFETNNVKNVAIIDKIFGMPTVDVDDVVITGIKVINKDKQEFLSGSEGYVVTIENNLLTEGKEQTIADNVARVVVGMRFRPLTARVQRNPLLQAGDIALFTYKGNTYQTILTNVDFTVGNHTSICCGAKSPLKNSSLQNGMRANAVMQKAKAETTQQLSAYDVMVQQLTSLVTQSFGVFKTETKLDDGSSILYMHDKPELATSKKVWRMSAGVFTVTDDYQGDSTVWKAGLDASGNAVLNVLSVIGLNADWINADTLSAISANLGTVNAGTIQSQNYSKNNTGMKLTLADGVWDSKNFKIDSQGNIYATGGTIGGLEFTNVGFFSDFFSITKELSRMTVKDENQPSKKAELYLDVINDEYRAIMEAADSIGIESPHISIGKYRSSSTTYDVLINGSTDITGNTYILGDLNVTGSKNRIVTTENYGQRKMNAFETGGAYFSDIGSVEVTEDDFVTVEINPMFKETVSLEKGYQVQITPTSPMTNFYVIKNTDSFEIHADNGATFDYMLMAKQKGYEDIYMEEFKEV